MCFHLTPLPTDLPIWLHRCPMCRKVIPIFVWKVLSLCQFCHIHTSPGLSDGGWDCWDVAKGSVSFHKKKTSEKVVFSCGHRVLSQQNHFFDDVMARCTFWIPRADFWDECHLCHLDLPHAQQLTTRTFISCVVGNPYKLLFATIAGWG